MLNDQDVVSCDDGVLHGTPVFTGTRVPVTTLFDYLLGGSSLDEFYEDFPTITRAHVAGMLTSIWTYFHFLPWEPTWAAPNSPDVYLKWPD